MKTIPIDALSLTQIERFWHHVDRGASCWEWRSAKDRGGYGRFKASEVSYAAHRVAYTLERGAINEGLVIDHLCRNHSCVNPAHLEAVTNLTNIKRGMAANGGPGRPKATHCKVGHEFTPENTIVVPKGKRCKTCHREYHRAYQKQYQAKLRAGKKAA